VRIHTKAAIALAATFAASVPAFAAPVSAPTQPPARALLLIPLTLTKVQDLHFGAIVPSTTTGGWVAINATTGARTASAGLTLWPAEVGQRGQFAGAGTPGQQVIMALTPPAQLTNPGGDTIDVLAMTLDGPTTRTIAADHSFFVGVGGTIFVAANQAEGLYSATYDLTADYQ
jgi:Domain of unknown function (DUF4402)